MAQPSQRTASATPVAVAGENMGPGGSPTEPPPVATISLSATPSTLSAVTRPLSASAGLTTTEIEAASKVIPVPKVASPGGPRKPPPSRLIIPSIGVDTKVIELNTRYNEQGELVWETAPFAAGHHVGTANPGEPGNVVISGHISSVKEGDVFRKLPEINVGDGIVIETKDRNYLYQVSDKKIVEPTQVEVMNSTGEKELTLITCFPDGIYSQRLIVIAKAI